MKYIPKQIAVDAVEVSSILKQMRNDWYGMPLWFRDAYEAGNFLLLHHEIHILHGGGGIYDVAPKGNWLIQDATGCITTLTAENFATTYEPEKDAEDDICQEIK